MAGVTTGTICDEYNGRVSDMAVRCAQRKIWSDRFSNRIAQIKRPGEAIRTSIHLSDGSRSHLVQCYNRPVLLTPVARGSAAPISSKISTSPLDAPLLFCYQIRFFSEEEIPPTQTHVGKLLRSNATMELANRAACFILSSDSRNEPLGALGGGAEVFLSRLILTLLFFFSYTTSSFTKFRDGGPLPLVLSTSFPLAGSGVA